ncbi:MAG: AAA family ATPase [Pseudomonadota bacterium]
MNLRQDNASIRRRRQGYYSYKAMDMVCISRCGLYFGINRGECGATLKRVLITGMSGTGKSTTICELAARGYRAIDLDSDQWSEWVPVDGDPTGANSGHDWMWRAERLESLLAVNDPGDLFVSGCAPNMGVFLPRFDHVILLRAPVAIMLERLASRTNNPYGKRPEEVAMVLENHRNIEPRLRKAAGYEIDASLPIPRVVDKVLAFASGTP